VPLVGAAVVPTPAARAAASAGPGAVAVELGAGLVVPAVPVIPGVLAVDPAVPEAPVAPAVGSVVAVLPDAADAVEVLPVFGGTWPPDRLTDVADVLLVIPGDAVGLVTPGVDALICVGLVKVNGSKLVAPGATHPTSMTAGPEREVDAAADGCVVGDCTAVGVVVDVV
jgi:hypothetical protein